MPGHGPSGIGNDGVAVGPDQLGAAQHRLRGGAQLAVVEVVVAADDDDVRARRELRVVDDPQAGVGHVVDERLRADHERRAAAAAAALGEHVLDGRADGDDLVDRRADAEAPQLAHELLGGSGGRRW